MKQSTAKMFDINLAKEIKLLKDVFPHDLFCTPSDNQQTETTQRYVVRVSNAIGLLGKDLEDNQYKSSKKVIEKKPIKSEDK